MAPKKAASAKPSAKAEKWVQSQLALLAEQCKAAEARGDSWLIEAHEWHEQQLGKVLKKLESDSTVSLPEELKEGVEFYLSQFAVGTVTSEEEFYNDQEVYSSFLVAEVKAAAALYVRAEETPESCLVIQQVEGWEDTNVSQQALSKLAKLARENGASAGVQEALLVKLAVLIDKNDEKLASAAGLAPKAMITLVVMTVDRFPEDVKLQVSAIRVLRTMVMGTGLAAVLEHGGVRIVTSALKRNMASEVMCLSGVAFISLLISKCKTHSPEWSIICASGTTEEILVELRPYHALNFNIEKMSKTAIPFLRG